MHQIKNKTLVLSVETILGASTIFCASNLEFVFGHNDDYYYVQFGEVLWSGVILLIGVGIGIALLFWKMPQDYTNVKHRCIWILKGLLSFFLGLLFAGFFIPAQI